MFLYETFTSSGVLGSARDSFAREMPFPVSRNKGLVDKLPLGHKLLRAVGGEERGTTAISLSLV
jgi:hypothetical protein